MHFPSTLALIAVALGAASIALPIDGYSDLTKRDEYFDPDSHMLGIDNFQVRDYELEDELAARGFGPLSGLAPTARWMQHCQKLGREAALPGDLLRRGTRDKPTIGVKGSNDPKHPVKPVKKKNMV